MMQIEFERRITLMNPAFELKEKLTSDTIFSFLNAYTLRFVRDNYLQEDLVADNTRAQKKNADALKGLVVRKKLTDKQRDGDNMDNSTVRFVLPEDYYLYIRSNSYVSSCYKGEIVDIPAEDDLANHLYVTPNKIIREDDVEKVISTYYNRTILRNPYVVLNAGQQEDTSENTYINIIHDTYTMVDSIDLVYYRRPKLFNVIGVDNINVLDHCELPSNVHMEIVEGAVEMFITEAKYRLTTKLN